MNIFEEEKNRQIIPRWLPFRETCKLIPPQAIDTSWMSRSVSPEALAIKRLEWNAHHHLIYAIDLVCSANLVGETNDSAVREAAAFILQESETTPTVRGVASLLLKRDAEPYSIDTVAVPEIRQRIHLLRKAAAGSRDPFLFLDLAFYYTLLAQNLKAVRCVGIALALGDDNPIVLRAAARFHLHADRSPEKALSLLRKASVTPYHPLLLASEISISEAFELKSPFRRIGGRLLLADFHPWILAELAGTVGTLELNSQSTRRAKEAFRLAVRCPNENTLAQLQWISNRLSVPVNIEPSCRPEATFEADTIVHFRAEEYGQALDSAVKWMRFQPFTARPAVLASFISSVALEDYDTSIALLREALIASPDSFTLRNNLVFALASKGQTEEAFESMRPVDTGRLSPKDAAVASATLGLIAFRRGETEQGREFYSAASREFGRLGDKHHAIVAEVFWAREEHLARTKQSAEVVARALSKSKNLKGFKVVEQLKRALQANAT